MALTATPDLAKGGITLAWGAVNATTRIYTRTNAGPGAWQLIKNNVAANTASIELMDGVYVGIAMDYQVVQLSAGGQETQIGLATNVTILPTTFNLPYESGGWDVMLHIVGSGLTYYCPMWTAKPIKKKQVIDSEAKLMFGNRAVSFRYGVGNYKDIQYTHKVKDSAQLSLWTALRDQVLAGGQLVYRDITGDLLYVGIAGGYDLDLEYYTDNQVHLIEQQYTFVP